MASASASGIGAAIEARRQRFAVEQLHDEKRLPVIFVELVERTDVRMADARGGARLAPEALARAFVRQRVRPHDLDRDRAIEPIVVRGIHDAHAALPEQRE